jgi:dolichol-phosphate mannosyltransferase
MDGPRSTTTGVRPVPEISVVIPMCNEQENVRSTVENVKETLESLGQAWELVLVDDGSTDSTLAIAREIAGEDTRIRPLTHGANLGRGQALRTGFAGSSGRYVITIDCDLSYSPAHILDMYRALKGDAHPDIVVASPYMKGGVTVGVPFLRLFVSRAANLLLGFALGGGIRTVTGIARGYRRETLETLDLSQSGKEIHLEIISKALAIGHRIVEIPATLTGRKKGSSKFSLRVTTLSHLLFSYYEKPLLFFGILGLILVLLGLIGGGAIIVMWQKGVLNPNRPLMTLVVLLLLGGVQALSLGFVGSQIASMRRDIFRIQSQAKWLQNSLNRPDGED